MKEREYPQVRVRVPPDHFAWLKDEAKANRRSLTAEVTVVVEEARKGREKEAAGQALQA